MSGTSLTTKNVLSNLVRLPSVQNSPRPGASVTTAEGVATSIY